MKKILLIITALLMVFTLYAQKIEIDEINPFNKRVILTSLEKINWKSPDYKLEVGMMLEGVEMSILLNWQCHEMVGAERDAKVVLTFDDASQIVLLNKAFSVSGSGKITSQNVPATTMGIQINAKGDFKALVDKELQTISIDTTSGEIVFPVSNEEVLSLRKLYEVFEKQLYKNKGK